MLFVSDRRALLNGLLAEANSSDRSHVAVSVPPKQEREEQTVSAAVAQPTDLNVNGRDGEHSDSTVSQHTRNGNSEESVETATSIASVDSGGHVAVVAPRVPSDSPPASSFSTPAASDSRPASDAPSAFPFFPYVVSDPCCALAAASLTASLAANDSCISSAVLDCVLAALSDALQAQTHRVYGGTAVANAPLHGDGHNQQSLAAGSPWQQPQPAQLVRGESHTASAALVAGVHDFVGPLTALSALLSLSDRLSESRVDECLSRLLVLARRVCARRPPAVCPPGSSQCINGSEERFLLSFVRCVLQLAANHKPIAAWLKAHAQEWHFLETLYTQARHMSGMQLIRSG